jgi:hypothetical protein
MSLMMAIRRMLFELIQGLSAKHHRKSSGGFPLTGDTAVLDL